MLRKWLERKAQAILEQTPLQQPAGAVIAVALEAIPDECLRPLFIAPSAEDILTALESWHWAPLDGLTAIAVTAFGDVFFRDTTGEIILLDSIQGMLIDVAADSAAMWRRFDDPAERDAMLLAALVEMLRGDGLKLAEGQCYDFLVPPALGGTTTADAVHCVDFAVKLQLTGEMHQELRGILTMTRRQNF